MSRRHPKEYLYMVCKYYAYGELLKEIKDIDTVKEMMDYIKEERRRLSVFK